MTELGFSLLTAILQQKNLKTCCDKIVPAIQIIIGSNFTLQTMFGFNKMRPAHALQ